MDLAVERKVSLGQSLSFEDGGNIAMFAAKETVPPEMFVMGVAQGELEYYEFELAPSPDKCTSLPAPRVDAQ